MKTIRCDWCHATFQRYPSKIQKTNFCSRSCLGKYRTKYWVGPEAAHWQGGQVSDRDRVKWHLPWHPLANAQGYVYRYRIVAELKLGRPLKSGEVVHHLDGNQQNDHPDNLEILPNQAEHARLHGLERGFGLMQKMRDARSQA